MSLWNKKSDGSDKSRHEREATQPEPTPLSPTRSLDVRPQANDIVKPMLLGDVAETPPEASIRGTTQAEAPQAVMTGAPNPQMLSEEQRRQAAAGAHRAAASFGGIVALLMRSGEYKYYALADLEWLVAPAVATGQFVLAEAQSNTNGLVAPVGMILWASVDPEVDQRLTANIDKPLRLKPQDWKSGDILWIVEALGEPRLIQSMLTELTKRWPGKPVKIRGRGQDGRPAVGILSEAKSKTERSAT